MGTAERTAKPEDMQILALGLAHDNATLGFYPYTGDTLAANRVYLTLPTTAEYVWVNSVDKYVSGAEYVFASDCKNGKPAGYYAGEFNEEALTAYAISNDEQLYFWTLTGTISSLTIENEKGDNLSLERNNNVNLSLTSDLDTWELLEDNTYGIRLRNNLYTHNETRYLLFDYSHNLFKNYSEGTEYTSFYLFRKVTPTATSQGYSFHFDDKAVGIKQATTKPTHGNIYYDLQGRQTTNPSRGMWIINGEKVYINK